MLGVFNLLEDNMVSFFQTLKLLISGRDEKGIRFRTKLSFVMAVAVLLIEIVTFFVKWDVIPDLLDYEFDLDGISRNVFEKEWLWGNLALQLIIVYVLLISKRYLYKFNKVKKYISNQKDEIIPIVDKRIQMFFVETAALFVTTEQSYIFAIANIIEDKVCDNVVTVLFLFWLVVLLIEFIFDIKHIKKTRE